MCFLKKLSFSALALGAWFFLTGCGVKGDPLPPEKPADIGRGRPTYKRATEEIKIQKRPARKHKPLRDDLDDDEDDSE